MSAPMTGAGYALIALGGALGALARYGVGSFVQQRLGPGFPWGTFVINATGSLVLGLVATLLAERFLTHPAWRPLVTVGFVGAYTTFSTFEYESLQLGSSWRALGNLLGSVVAGYACVWAGARLAHWVIGHWGVNPLPIGCHRSTDSSSGTVRADRAVDVNTTPTA